MFVDIFWWYGIIYTIYTIFYSAPEQRWVWLGSKVWYGIWLRKKERKNKECTMLKAAGENENNNPAGWNVDGVREDVTDIILATPTGIRDDASASIVSASGMPCSEALPMQSIKVRRRFLRFCDQMVRQ